MTNQQEANLSLEVWQQLKAMGIPPEQRLQALDDQMRIDSLLREFLRPSRADEYEAIQSRVSEIMSCVPEDLSPQAISS